MPSCVRISALQAGAGVSVSVPMRCLRMVAPRRNRTLPALAALCAVVLVVAGCGSSSDGGGGSTPTLTVSAAASLKDAFTTCAQSFKQAKLKFSFAGSDQLAAQIRQGASPNVFASANTKL